MGRGAVLFTLELQIYMFAVMAVTGVALGIWYDLYRAARHIFVWRGVAADVQDFLFWVGAAALVLAGLYAGSRVEVRLYVPVGLATGFAFYYFTASPVFVGAWVWLFGTAARAARRAGGILKNIFPAQK